MQNNNPLFVTECLAVNRIVNGKHGKPEEDFYEDDDRPYIVARLFMWLLRAGRRGHFSANAAAAEHPVHDTALTDH